MQNKDEILNAILSNSPDGYLISDKFGKLIYMNKKIESITGFLSSEIIGNDFSKICTISENIKDKNTTAQEVVSTLTKKDGKKIHFPARVVELKSENEKKDFNGYLLIIHLENKNEPVDKAQIEFVSTVSHELRTPLTSIRGFADTLIRSGEKLPEETRRKYINIIRDQAARLGRLVENLLSVSRLESKNIQPTIRAIDLEKAIHKVCDTLSSKSSEHKIIIDIKKHIPLVQADADKLEQILTNLIDNAIKYSPKNSSITITANPIINEESVPTKIKIEIIDEGVGIPEKDLEKIFTKFGRLDHPLTRQTQGTGLGLFITKSLVISLKGEISVTSKAGKTTFTIILPAHIPSQGIPLPISESEKSELRQVN